MIPRSCLLIESKKFPIQPGEDQEITNERMYGKALCTYLQEHLPRAGVNVPFFCNEDWGWWLEVERGDFKMALCIYSDPDAEGNPEKYALMPSIDKEKNGHGRVLGKLMFQRTSWRLSMSLNAHSRVIRMFRLSRDTMISLFSPVAHEAPTSRCRRRLPARLTCDVGRTSQWTQQTWCSGCVPR